MLVYSRQAPLWSYLHLHVVEVLARIIIPKYLHMRRRRILLMPAIKVGVSTLVMPPWSLMTHSTIVANYSACHYHCQEW